MELKKLLQECQRELIAHDIRIYRIEVVLGLHVDPL